MPGNRLYVGPVGENGVVCPFATTQDMGKEVPAPSSALPACNDGELATFALVDFDAYRRANDMRTIRKNVTLPSYLNDLAEKAGLNFSRILQDAL